MKKIGLLLFLIVSFLVISPNASYALKLQTDTTASSGADDLQFTTVGSKEDSVANSKTESAAKKDTAKVSVATDKATTAPQSLWVTFGLGLLAGIAAFFLPCIFPMVPLTVGFFTKRAESKGKGIRSAIIYGLSIIIIYVGLGVIITLIWGASALNQISTDGFFNVFIFFCK